MNRGHLYVLQTKKLGQGLDGIVVGLDGDMAVKVNKLHPKELKQGETEECHRRVEAESEQRFKKEVPYCPWCTSWVRTLSCLVI